MTRSAVLSTLPVPTRVLEIPVTVPAKAGLVREVFWSRADCAAVFFGLARSAVLSMPPKPRIALEMPPTVPVKVGEASGALKLRLVVTSAELVFVASVLWASVRV